jgi:hypothetical protein
MLTAGWNFAESLGLPLAGYLAGAQLGDQDAGMVTAAAVTAHRDPAVPYHHPVGSPNAGSSTRIRPLLRMSARLSSPTGIR